MNSLPAYDSLKFSLSPIPYVDENRMRKCIDCYGYDSFPKIVAILQRAHAEGIAVSCKLKGTFVHVVCGLTPKKKINDTDVVFEIKHWPQAEAVFLYCREIFGDALKVGKTSSKFYNFNVDSQPVPLDMTLLIPNANIPDCTSAFDAFALEVLLRGEVNVDLLPMQSHWVDSYCTLAETCRLITENMDRVSREHALATNKGLIRYVYKLTRGLFPEDLSTIPQLDEAYCSAFYAQYNNSKGLKILAENLKDQVLKHFNLQDPNELREINSFFAHFFRLICKYDISLENQPVFIDKNSLIHMVESIRSIFLEKVEFGQAVEEEKKNSKKEETPQRVKMISLPIPRNEETFTPKDGRKKTSRSDKQEPHQSKIALSTIRENKESVAKIEARKKTSRNIEKLQEDQPLRCNAVEDEEFSVRKEKGETNSEESVRLPFLPNPRSVGHSSDIQDENPLKHIHSLEQYVQKAATFKDVPLDINVTHFMKLLKKKKHEKAIDGVEDCVHTLLLELEKKSLDPTPLTIFYFTFFSPSHHMASYWFRDAMEKGSRRRAQSIYNSFKPSDRHLLLLFEICKEMEEKSIKLPPETSSLCIEWIVEQLTPTSDLILFNSFKLLLNEKKTRIKFELITSVYPKVAKDEKEELNIILLELLLLRDILYGDFLFLYQKMEKSAELFPSLLMFQVFQRKILSSSEDNRSNDFLQGELQRFEKRAFHPPESSLLEGFAAVFDHCQEDFCRLMHRPLPNRDLSRVRKLPPLATIQHKKNHKKVMRKDEEIEGINPRVIGVALAVMSVFGGIGLCYMAYTASPNSKKDLWDGAESLCSGIGFTAVGMSTLVMTTYVLNQPMKLLLEDPYFQIKAFGIFVIFNLVCTTQMTKQMLLGQNDVEEMDEKKIPPSVFLLFIGSVMGFFLTKQTLFFLLRCKEKQLQNMLLKALPPPAPQKNKPPTLNLLNADILMTNADMLMMWSNVIEWLGYSGYKDPSLSNLGVARICLLSSSIILQIANLSMYKTNPTIINKITLMVLPGTMPLAGPYGLELMKRITALYILNVRSFPGLIHCSEHFDARSIRFDARSIRLLNSMLVHFFNLISEFNFTFCHMNSTLNY